MTVSTPKHREIGTIIQLSNEEATRHALARTGPVITSTGLILAGAFSALTTLPLQDLLQLGFGVAIGVLMDTFITRTPVVPSVVSLLGRWNWWPSRQSLEWG